MQHVNIRIGRGPRSVHRERGRERTRCESCVQSCAFTAYKNTNSLCVQDKALSASQKSAYLYITQTTQHTQPGHVKMRRPTNENCSTSLSSVARKLNQFRHRPKNSYSAKNKNKIAKPRHHIKSKMHKHEMR